MVSVSMRSMLFPGVALVTVGAVALGPAFAAPPPMAAPAAAPIPAVYVADIALAGIGRDIYNSLSATVQGLVQWAEFAVGLIPFLGGGIRGQIDINYFGLIQPLIANTVYALSNIVADPLGILNTVGSYISNQVYVGYTWVTDQIAFFGLPPLLGPIPAPPRLASVGESATAPVAARTLGPRAAAALAALPAAPAESVPVETVLAETAPVEAAPEFAPAEAVPAEAAAAEVGTPARSVRVSGAPHCRRRPPGHSGHRRTGGPRSPGRRRGRCCRPGTGSRQGHPRRARPGRRTVSRRHRTRCQRLCLTTDSRSVKLTPVAPTESEETW